MNFPQIKGINYCFKSVSVDHLKELQNDFDVGNFNGNLSDNETYRYYLSYKKFAIPKALPDSKSLIILAISTRLMRVKFHLEGEIFDVIVPPPYYDDGLTFEEIENLIKDEIIKESGYEIEETRNQLFLKILAVRSGLAKYGRNNISYIKGMGSFFSLYAYYTNFKMPSDGWCNLELMELCQNCNYCLRSCPTNAIRESNFIIDAGRCISLYNEIDGEIPKWVNPNSHHALMGCIQCQSHCPGNNEKLKNVGYFEDISNKETKMLLDGDFNSELIKSLSVKIKMFDMSNGEKYLPRLSRNLNLIIKQRK